MRQKLLVVTALAVLVILNHAIVAKERVLSAGRTFHLQLAPVDPRSLMQGDYMRLRYAIENVARAQRHPGAHGPGRLVVRIDEDGIGHFARFHDGAALATDEAPVRYRDDGTWLHVTPDSYLFQEGHRALYQDARYGVFKTLDGETLLTGLADAGLRRIDP